MANQRSNEPKKKPTPLENEAQRRKKEEQARRSRRRGRQWIGVALSVLVLVGVYSIVRGGIDVARNILDNQSEKEEYAARLRPMVWADILPFEAVGQVDQGELKQIAIWGVMLEQGDNIGRDENERAIIPVLEVDHYAAELFGAPPRFRFLEHGTFTNVLQGITYEYDAARNAYIVPPVGLTPAFDPVVVEIRNEGNGIRRVTVGYVSLIGEGGELVSIPDKEHPVRYMDFLFQRDGSEYYLYALVPNNVYKPAVREQESTPPVVVDSHSEESLPPPAVSTSLVPESTPVEAGEGTEESTAESVDGGETGSAEGTNSASASGV